MKTVDCESDEALSANLYVEAAGCMKKVNTSEAVKIMEKAIEAFCSTGGIRMVFKLFLRDRERNSRGKLQNGTKKTLNMNLPSNIT